MIFIYDSCLILSGLDINESDKEGYLVVLIQAGPHLTGQGLSVRGGDRHPAGLPLKGGQGVHVLLIGVDEVAHAGGGVVILEEVAAAAVRVAVQTFQNGQVIVAVGLHHAGDAGGIVGAVGLIAPGAQGVDVALACW